jgi:hypothetical protein
MSSPGMSAIEETFRVMCIDPEWSEWNDHGFVWWGKNLAQRVWAEKPFEEVGLNITRVHVRTDLVDGFQGSDAQWNVLEHTLGLSTLSGIVRSRTETGRLQLAARFYVHEDNLTWMNRLVPFVVALQATEAHQIAGPLAELLGCTVAESQHPLTGRREEPDEMVSLIDTFYRSDDGTDVSQFRGWEIEEALEILKLQRIQHEGDETGLTAEFQFGSETTLFTMATGEANPVFGPGLLSRLTLPVRGDELKYRRPAQMAVELNTREIHEFTQSHFLGSWSPSRNGMTFVSFCPNVLGQAVPGFTKNLLQNNMIRAKWAAEDVFHAD